MMESCFSLKTRKETRLSMTNNDWFGVVRWCDDDIVCLLKDMCIEPTEDNVAKVRCACENNHYFTDSMIEAGWNTMEYIAEDVLGIE